MNQHSYTRIDKGVERKKPGPMPGLPQVGGTNRAILPRSGPARDDAIAEALQDYSAGLTLTEIGEKHGVSERAIRAWLLSEVGPEYHLAQTNGLLTRIAEADEGISEAKTSRDLVLLACAREQARFSRMDLERRRPHLYGPKQEITTNVQPVMTINIVSSAPQNVVSNVVTSALTHHDSDIDQ